MNHSDLTSLYSTLSGIGGIAVIIWVSVQARIARLRAEAQIRQQAASPPQDSELLAEFRALKQQVTEMHSTSHQFDLSFDEALNRLEGRIARLELKSAAGVADTSAQATLRNGVTSVP